MAESTRTALRPIPKIAVGVAGFVLLGAILGAGRIGNLAALCAGTLAVVTLAFAVGNFLRRRERVRQIDTRLRIIAAQILEISEDPRPYPNPGAVIIGLRDERTKLLVERRLIATWPLK